MKTTIFNRLAMFGLAALVASTVSTRAADAALPAKSVVATNAANSPVPAFVSMNGRVAVVDAAKNNLTLVTASGARLIHCRPTTKDRNGGSVVKASNFKAGDHLVVRAVQETDGSLSAVYLARPLVSLPPMTAPQPSKSPATETAPKKP